MRHSSIILLLFIFYCKTDPIIHFIENYQKEETLINGDRCPLYPTCSQYTKESLNKNFFSGFLLTLERIFIRERGDLSKKFISIPEEFSPNKKRYYDPVTNSLEEPSLLKEDF